MSYKGHLQIYMRFLSNHNKRSIIKDQLLIDKMILHDCRKRHTYLGMTWTGYKKVHNMVSHSWILESLELVQVSDNILEFSKKINGKLAKS